MSENLVKIEINVEKAVYESAHKRFSDRQIEELLVQQLKDISVLDDPLPILRAFAEFVDFLEMNRAKLAKFPHEVIDAVLQVLNEVSRDKDRELIPEITRRFNALLQSQYGNRFKQYSGKNMGRLLSLLGFNGRTKSRGGNIVLIDRGLLQHYLKGVT